MAAPGSEHGLNAPPAVIHLAKRVSILTGTSGSLKENDALGPGLITPLFRAWGPHKWNQNRKNCPVVPIIQLSSYLVH